MADERLVTIFWSKEPAGHAEAEVIRGLLDSAGIPAHVRWKRSFREPLGGVLVEVREEDRADAEELMRQAQRPWEDSDRAEGAEFG